MKHFLIKSLFFLFIFLLIVPFTSNSAGQYTPKFSWRVLGGSVTPEQWIYDGDNPIAMFENRTIEQPGLQLMFFNMSSKPPALRHLKLTPDGNPMIEFVQLYDKFSPICTDKLVGLDVKGQGTDKLVVTFTTEDAFKVATSTKVLTLSYDNEKGSYVYDINGNLKFNSPEFLNGSSFGFEYLDPWFVGCPGPAVKFPGMWDKRYQSFVYEDKDGGVKIFPINHFVTSYKGPFKLKQNGIFVTAYEPDGNPAIQLIGDTADKSSMSICWWGYDFHFTRSGSADELFAPINYHYSLFQCPDAVVKDFLKKGITTAMPDNEFGPLKEYPIYERISSFDKGLRPDGFFKGDTDPFTWTVKGNGAEWDKTFGKTDKFSLKISKKETGLTRWSTMMGDGEGYFTEPWTPNNGFKISCWVKTDNVAGRGSTLAIQYFVPNSPQRYPVIAAKRITGTADWTKLEVEIGPNGPVPPEVGCISIYLQQDGSGTTWFDDLEVKPIK